MTRPSLGTRTIICAQCTKEYTYNRGNRKGASATKCNSCIVANKRKNLKQQAIEYKGGRCKICGYNKSMRALQFHHIRPEIKEFGIGDAGHTRSWERIKKEIDKCILVCANCHAEIEDDIQAAKEFFKSGKIPERIKDVAHPLDFEEFVQLLHASRN